MPLRDSLRINRFPHYPSPKPPLLSPSKLLHPSPSRRLRGKEHRGATQVQIGDSGPRPYTKIDPPAQPTGRDCCPYSSAASSPTGANPIPSTSLTFASTSSMTAWLSRRNILAFSRPCPMRWLL